MCFGWRRMTTLVCPWVGVIRMCFEVRTHCFDSPLVYSIGWWFERGWVVCDGGYGVGWWVVPFFYGAQIFLNSSVRFFVPDFLPRFFTKCWDFLSRFFVQIFWSRFLSRFFVSNFLFRFFTTCWDFLSRFFVQIFRSRFFVQIVCSGFFGLDFSFRFFVQNF